MATLGADVRCRNCRKKARFLCGLTAVCSHGCAIEYAKKNAEKHKAKKHRLDKERVKTRGERMREAQAAFNAYIRARDKGRPCVSCSRPDDGLHQRHAGHYRSVGAHPELRFDEANCHAQCSQCNNYLSGNLVAYRASLIERIGINEVLRLEGDHEPQKLTAAQIDEIKAKYRAMTRELSR